MNSSQDLRDQLFELKHFRFTKMRFLVRKQDINCTSAVPIRPTSNSTFEEALPEIMKSYFLRSIIPKIRVRIYKRLYTDILVSELELLFECMLEMVKEKENDIFYCYENTDEVPTVEINERFEWSACLVTPDFDGQLIDSKSIGCFDQTSSGDLHYQHFLTGLDYITGPNEIIIGSSGRNICCCCTIFPLEIRSEI